MAMRVPTVSFIGSSSSSTSSPSPSPTTFTSGFATKPSSPDSARPPEATPSPPRGARRTRLPGPPLRAADSPKRFGVVAELGP
eukprot:306366-Chlamydomonas_euryale.AAC.4